MAFADTLRKWPRELDALVEGWARCLRRVLLPRGGRERTVLRFGEIHRTMRETARVAARAAARSLRSARRGSKEGYLPGRLGCGR